MDDILSYLRIARLVHDGEQDEWKERRTRRDAFVLAAAAIVQTVDNYQRLRRLHGVHINPVASVPDFGLEAPINEQTVIGHLTQSGFSDYEAAAAGHFAHAVLTDPRFEDGSQESADTGSESNPNNTGTPIVIDDPVIADGSPAEQGNTHAVSPDVTMTGDEEERHSPAPSA
ncbi:hypothetical protein FA95DRAFT_1602413 [Auriscalpium vulgare]|uniref:Uncharacterized protein n=1 Tax=Auriscalpium vulgare TaxID=40419 RepID=A0ACB8S5W2_9AGAM|nr:hypothetical protein FA95DRAFT_1602413 [Auriscalpium vulgare]